MSAPHARMFVADALDHLPADGSQPAVFTSMPDAAELDLPIDRWRDWFAHAARRTIATVAPKGYAVFYQTDRRVDGSTQDKGALIAAAAESVGANVVWHKIAVATRGVSLFRPAYTHLIAVSVKGTAGRPTADVFDKGAKVYPNATDDAACDVAMSFLVSKGVGHVFDPFCGRGSIAYHAARFGMSSLSIDIDPEQVKQAALLASKVATVEVVSA